MAVIRVSKRNAFVVPKLLEGLMIDELKTTMKYSSEHWFRVLMINKQFLRATLVAALFTATLTAQNAPTLRQGNVELGLFAGAGYGLSVTGTVNNNESVSVPSFHAVFGGDFGYAITKSIFVVGESSYFPSLGVSNASSSPFCTSSVGGSCQQMQQIVDTYKRRIVEVNGGIHYRLPVPESRFVPYLAGGVGAVHSLSSTVTQAVTCSGSCSGFQTGSSQTSSLNGASAFEVAVGAGARMYLSEHFGFRGEFRFYHPFGVDNLGSFYRVSGGLFFQLK